MIPVIHEWYTTKPNPESELCLNGRLYGHDSKRVGEFVTTAPIREVYRHMLKNYGIVALTEDGGEYILGRVDKRFEEKYDNIIERMLKRFSLYKESEEQWK